MYDFLFHLSSLDPGYPQFFMYCIVAANILFEKPSNALLLYDFFVRLYIMCQRSLCLT
jgi:hypothetical protein